jgi:PPE-repeat protein
MYSGPGSGPMLAAASAWGQLAHELNSAAVVYGSVITNLTTTGWHGPSSMTMVSAVAPYVAWLHSTAAAAEQTAAQAKTAAGAYHTAFAMTVPPPQIQTNRTRLHWLVASNFFGQNSPAIAATEAHYDEMWAQDTAAMYGYATSSATASTLTPFTDPPRTTDSAGQVAQAAAAAQSAAAAAPTAAAGSPSLLTYLLDIPSIASATASTSSSSFSGSSIVTTNHALAVNALRDEAQDIGPFLAESTRPPASAGPVRVGGPPVSAAMGRASLVGTLSAPQTWAATASPAVNPATIALPGTGVTAAPEAWSAPPQGSMLGEALLGTLAGRGVSAAAGKMRTSVIPRSPAAG